MHPTLRPAGFLAALALLTAGCGNKAQPEMPQPVSEESAPPEAPYVPPTVSVAPIPTEILDQARRATLEERISFDFDQSDLTLDAREKLSAKAEILRAIPSLTLRIEGHADERGSDEYNLALSNRRAGAALRYLANHGVAVERLESVGFGEERPLNPAETESAWALNRRDEFRVNLERLANH